MKLISREELKEKLDNAQDIRLVFALSDSRYRAKHIPGSLHFDKLEEALQVLDNDDEIIVYCANPACPASISAYHFLIGHGYKNVRRYAGGLQEWEDAGYPLEGEDATALTGGQLSLPRIRSERNPTRTNEALANTGIPSRAKSA